MGIGASAGGLEAIGQLLSNLSPTTGMAFIIVQHLDPTHESMTTEILAKKTSMPVAEAKDGVHVDRNHIYVIPPNYRLAIRQQTLRLLPRGEGPTVHLPINFFLKSLAEDQKSRSVAVILSGTASDGTQGLESIKAEGGFTIAQTPESARYDGMPRSAISSGYVDLILAPKQIAEELGRFARHPLLLRASPAVVDSQVDSLDHTDLEGDFSRILKLVGDQCHLDFTSYRKSTIKRRIERRMVLRKKETLKEYLTNLEVNPEEVKLLFADLLINVTEFFRDPKTIAGLKTQVFPKILKGKPPKSPIRIWVVGCSTGEEAYAVAISLREYLGEAASQTHIQIFGTDISESAIAKARIGEYPESISQNVSKERLQRFFTKIEGGYRINKLIRELCLFSRHDVTRDTPFARLDLVCCRNVLIYFETSLQKRVIPIFHYSLNPGGCLWLGKSETVGNLSTLFTLTDKAKKFYLRKPVATMPLFQFPASRFVAEKMARSRTQEGIVAEPENVQTAADRIALTEFVPPSIVVNSEMEVTLNRGDTTPYLHLPSGRTSLNIFKMARPQLVANLRMMIQAAKMKGEPVKKSGLTVGGEQGKEFSVNVFPMKTSPQSKEWYFAIFFSMTPTKSLGETAAQTEILGKNSKRSPAAIHSMIREIKNLKQELAELKSYQQALTVDSEATKEELTAANEEMQSTNEEFQSTNEELETAKEELQSANEELSTVNDELQIRNLELSQLTDDLINLLGTVDIPIVMVGIDGRIRRFTPKAGKLMNLIPSDVGRPFNNIKQDLHSPDLPELIAEVIDNITTKESEVQDGSGHWFRLQIRPYKTAENRIDGVVLALVDINELKRGFEERQSALEYATSIANTVELPLVVLDGKLRFLSANNAFYEKFRDVLVKVESKFFSAFGSSTDVHLKKELIDVIHSGSEVKQLEAEFEFPQQGLRTLVFNSRQIRWLGEQANALLLSIDDITERRKLERELEASEKMLQGLVLREKEARADAERANQSKDDFLATLSHELRTPLTSILSWAQVLQRIKDEPEKIEKGIQTIEQSAKLQGQLIDDLLDVSRIQSGKLSINFADVDPREIVRSAVESVRMMADKKRVTIETKIEIESEVVWADPVRLQQVLWNLLTNAIKFSSQGSRIWVRVDSKEESGQKLVSVKVIDQGKGIKPEFLSKLFKRFSQADSSSIRIHGGLGLGLAIVSDLLRLQNGTVHAESEGLGKGATFTVLLPAKLDTEMTFAPRTRAERKNVTDTELPNLTGLCVMIVEDEPGTREALNVALNSFGAKTCSCASVAEALAVFEKIKPDILVSDIAMPEEDGNSLIRKIRNLGPNPSCADLTRNL